MKRSQLFVRISGTVRKTFAVLLPSLALALLFWVNARSQDHDRLKIVEPPSPVVTSSFDVGSYKIHFFENPGARTRNPAERSVLVLGTFSNSGAVFDSRNYINPSTGKRFDVIVGIGVDDLPAEIKRVVLEDHVNADRNAAALRTAIIQRYGGPLDCSTVYVHSNGTTVGIAATLKGTFGSVHQLNIMGPDIGYGGTYLNRDSMAKLKAVGVESVNIYRNHGDIVPSLGYITKALGDSIPGASVADQTIKSLRAVVDLTTAAKDANLPTIRSFEIKTDFGHFVNNHIAQNYLDAIAGFTKDEGLTKSPANAAPTDAKGVRIFIDDEILTSALSGSSPQENKQLFAELEQQLTSSKDDGETGSSLANFGDTLKQRFKRSRNTTMLENVVMVSLKQLLEDSTPYSNNWTSLPNNLKHPGLITRINGYVAVPEKDDILLVGSSNPAEPPIDIDDIIVGINSVWKEEKVPFCSLDPDPENVAGPQKVRISGVPADSAFALKMLEADYSMKKIMFGLDPVDIPGYRSHATILKSDPIKKRSINRFWLYPIQPQAGEIEVSSDTNAGLFAAGVQVLSEQMVETREGFAGSGAIDPEADVAASLFTRYYSEIARTRPEFQRLQGLFDIVLMARIWQHNRLRSDMLDRLVKLPHETADVPESYNGLRAVISEENGVVFALSGGVQAKTNSGSRSINAFDDAGLIAFQGRVRQPRSGSDPAFPLSNASLSIVSANRSDRDNLNLAVSSAMGRVAAGDFQGARAILDKAIRDNPFDAEPLAIRAFVGFIGGDISAARSDALAAENRDPENSDISNIAATVLFQCELIEGKPDVAMQRIEWELRNDSDSVRSHILRATALVQLNRRADARKELSAAVQMVPTSALALAKLGMLELSEGWLVRGRKLITKAWTMAKALHQEGPEIKVTLAFAEMAYAAYGNVKTQLTIAQTVAEQVIADPACDPQSALEALAVLTGSSMLNEDWTRADQYVTRAKQYAPYSPELLILAAQMANDDKRDDIAQRYLAQAALIAPNNPAVIALRQKMGR